MNFKSLWDHHPSNNDDTFPCWNWDKQEPNFTNQCAIRMGVALHGVGFDFKEYEGRLCWHGCSEPHPLRVEEMVKFLRMELGRPLSFMNIDDDEFKRKTDCATGIVVFLDFWGRNMQGDHIDLWNGEDQTYGAPDYFERAREVLFWEIE